LRNNARAMKPGRGTVNHDRCNQKESELFYGSGTRVAGSRGKAGSRAKGANSGALRNVRWNGTDASGREDTKEQ
jgi:hypothetical protein